MSSETAIWPKVARRIRVPTGFAFTILYIWLARPTWKSLSCGLLLIVAGLFVRALASGHVRKNEELTTSGPYSHTRNPLYLGSIMLAAGFSVAAMSWWVAVVATLIFVVIYVPVIRSEEQFLRANFPEFAEYSTRVPRLIPRVTGFRRESGNFSWALYLKHREYNAAIGGAALVAALIAKLVWTKG